MKTTSGEATPVAAVEKDVPSLGYVEHAGHDAVQDVEKTAAEPLAAPQAVATTSTPALDIGPPPEGGALAWMTVGGSFLATLASFGITNAYGVFQAYYAENQLKSYNASTISWIGAIQQFLLFFNGVSLFGFSIRAPSDIKLIAGRLFDAFGCVPVFISGTIMCTLSLMMTSCKLPCAPY